MINKGFNKSKFNKRSLQNHSESPKFTKSKIPIIYEDDYIIAVNKPPNVGVVPGETVREDRSLIYVLKQQYPEFKDAYLLHRLDLKTSGILLLGKDEKYREQLEQIMREDSTQKTYWTLIKGKMKYKEGVIDKKVQSRSSGMQLKSFSRFKVLKEFKYVSLLEIQIQTGRKHQIRKQFSIIYHPVILDRQFGDFRLNRLFQRKYGLKRQFLHAKSIHFTHPILNKRIDITTPLARDLEDTLSALK